MKTIKYLKYLAIGIIYYFLIFFLVYTISGFLLIKGITPEIKLIKEYQRNFLVLHFHWLIK